ncbi:MAG: response regulator, partial [Bacteroidota bacterium]
EIEPLIEVDPTIIKSANNIVYITITIIFLYESICVYYLHEVAIEDLEEREQEMSIARDKAEESDQLKSAFLANISHEIRTPMNSIIGFSEYLVQEETEEQDKLQYAEIINQSCHQLLNLVNDVLDISKIETGQVVINPKVSNLSKMLISLYQLFENVAHNKGISLHLNSTIPEEATMVMLDETKVRQILSNFISNALKYTEKGEVKLGCDLKDDQLHFYVSDTGIGIKQLDQDTIFDRFRQVGDSSNKGAGLGLAISKGFAESMGGSVAVESLLGKGSTFSLVLPYEAALVEKLLPASNPDSSKPSLLDLSNKCVLIAEDELFNFKLLEIIFKQLSVKIIWAKNGKEAVEMVTQNPSFDMILMDIKMPIMNGLEATQRIKKIHPSISIIAQSAFAFTDEREQCLKAGCDDYISKPIKKQELLKLFEHCILKKESSQKAGTHE